METVDIIGYLAAFFGTILLVPQVYKTVKTKRVDDVSLVMLIVYVINCSLWEIYGLLINSLPIILCNLIAGIIGIFQLRLKIKYEKKKSEI